MRRGALLDRGHENIGRRDADMVEGVLPFLSLDHLGNFDFVQILGLGEFWGERPVAYESRWSELLVGLHALQEPIAFLVLCKAGSGISYRIGSPAHRSVALALTMQGLLPDCRTHRADHPKTRANLLNGLGQLTEWREAIGIPKPPRSHPTADSGLVGHLVRGLKAANWGLLIIAAPIEQTLIRNELDALGAEIRQLGGMDQRTVQEALGSRRLVDAVTRDYVGDLEAQFQRMTDARRLGGWDCHTYLIAEEQTGLSAMTAIFQAALGGYRDRAVTTIPVRSPISPADTSPGTILTSREVAAVTRPPREEVPGLQITDYAKFDTHVEIPLGDSVVLGHVLDFAHVPVGTPLNSLSAHALISGKTGSGKTTAVWHLLRWLADHSIPFLVIEPAKREYRALPLNDLHIFTIGDSRTNPMKLNPFEVPRGVLPQTHIEHLVALFSAAFVLWPPLPEVLELSIPAIYEDLDIDLDSPPPEGTTFPTLTDLFCKVNSIASTLGYGEEVERNIRAGLLTRIETLRRGSKGAMLDHSDPFDDEAFLSMQVIVELHHIGDNQVKAVLMGLLLLRVFEHRQSAITNGSQALKHVTLVEEAHRLFANHNQTSHPEMGNPSLHGVQQFANMLAEARAAGEGIVVIDQCPSKLMPDVIKNTDLKVVFRLAAEDDKQAVGSSINLSPEQARVLTALPRGQALVFGDGMDRPVRTVMFGHELRDRAVCRTDAEIRDLARKGGLQRASL